MKLCSAVFAVDRPDEALDAAFAALGLAGAPGREHRFAPHGVSAVRSGEKGWVAVHTWPELGRATVDAYGDFDLDALGWTRLDDPPSRAECGRIPGAVSYVDTSRDLYRRGRVRIAETGVYGRVLFVGGEAHSSERDGEELHRALIWPVRGARRVLVVGGETGAEARLLFAHGAERVRLADPDPLLLDAARRHLGAWHHGALDRVELGEPHDETWDAVILGRGLDRLAAVREAWPGAAVTARIGLGPVEGSLAELWRSFPDAVGYSWGTATLGARCGFVASRAPAEIDGFWRALTDG